MSILNKAQLITYADSLGGDLGALNGLLRAHFSDLFPGGVHILPPFPSSADRGFAPKTYFEIDPAFGTWEDMKRIGEGFPILVDVMVNHISRQSEAFRDFVRRGRASPTADLFLTVDKVWPGGLVPDADVRRIFLRKPDHPFTDIIVEETGARETVWTSFGTKDWSEQVDLDVHSPLTQHFFGKVFEHLSQNGIRIVRLDAVGYVIKKPGTSCFFVEPEIWEFLSWIKNLADSCGIDLLPEVHAPFSYQRNLADHGYWVYDFVLPGLVLHTLFSGSTDKLAEHLRSCPRRQFTTLDCHDGIPIQPDLDGILTLAEARAVVSQCEARGANINRILGEKKGPDGFDAHQINITYYDALDRDDDAYILARAIQCFAPGVPQIYYVGLLAGTNDQNAFSVSGEGRAVNRHNYTVEEIERDLQRPVVRRLEALIRFRNTHPAFQGVFTVRNDSGEASGMVLTWTSGLDMCSLSFRPKSGVCEIIFTEGAGSLSVWRP